MPDLPFSQRCFLLNGSAVDIEDWLSARYPDPKFQALMRQDLTSLSPGDSCYMLQDAGTGDELTRIS